MSDASVGYPPGLTRERLISFARNIINNGFSSKHYSSKKDEIVLFTTRSYSVSQMCNRNLYKNTIHRSREF
jgi:hypothetical protein